MMYQGFFYLMSLNSVPKIHRRQLVEVIVAKRIQIFHY